MRVAENKIKSPAKLNLRLKVTGIRSDGYHNIVSLMVPINLFDVLAFRFTALAEDKIAGTGYQVPSDNSNLIMKAVRAFREETGATSGITVELQKNIPVSAGLGGGSSNAAAALFFMNEALGKPLSPGKLHELAALLGADVPFFLDCRPAVAQGIGEILEPIDSWAQHWYVIVAPPLQVSTAWVYGNYRLNELTRDEYHYIKDQLGNDSLAVAHILDNDLETVTSASFPIIETIKIHLREAGAEGVLMSGSGPSVFGVFKDEQHARRARRLIASLNLGDVFAVTDRI